MRINKVNSAQLTRVSPALTSACLGFSGVFFFFSVRGLLLDSPKLGLRWGHVRLSAFVQLPLQIALAGRILRDVI